MTEDNQLGAARAWLAEGFSRGMQPRCGTVCCPEKVAAVAAIRRGEADKIIDLASVPCPSGHGNELNLDELETAHGIRGARVIAQSNNSAQGVG